MKVSIIVDTVDKTTYQSDWADLTDDEVDSIRDLVRQRNLDYLEIFRAGNSITIRGDKIVAVTILKENTHG